MFLCVPRRLLLLLAKWPKNAAMNFFIKNIFSLARPPINNNFIRLPAAVARATRFRVSAARKPWITVCVCAGQAFGTFAAEESKQDRSRE